MYRFLSRLRLLKALGLDTDIRRLIYDIAWAVQVASLDPRCRQKLLWITNIHEFWDTNFYLQQTYRGKIKSMN